MLILVAVTVSILINSGLIGKAKEGAEKTKTSYEQEQRLGESININGVVYNSIDEIVKSTGMSNLEKLQLYFSDESNYNPNPSGEDDLLFDNTELEVYVSDLYSICDKESSNGNYLYVYNYYKYSDDIIYKVAYVYNSDNYEECIVTKESSKIDFTKFGEHELTDGLKILVTPERPEGYRELLIHLIDEDNTYSPGSYQFYELEDGREYWDENEEEWKPFTGYAAYFTLDSGWSAQYVYFDLEGNIVTVYD